RPPGDDGPLRSPASSTLPHRDAPAVSSFLCPSSHSPFGRLTNSLAPVRVAKAPPAPCREGFGAASAIHRRKATLTGPLPRGGEATVFLGQPCQMLPVEDRGAAVRAREDVDDPVHVLTPGDLPRVGKPRGFLHRAALSCYPTRCRWGRVTLTPTGTQTA